MANIGGSHTEAFGMGVNHTVNPGRGNYGSITMADSGVDPGWPGPGTTPHSVLSTTPGSAESSSGIGYAGVQRLSGSGMQPGALGRFADSMSAGADDNLTTGEE
jgi:hypothetical protein